MGILIKKRVSLEFLGEEYGNAYLTFRSIPAVDFEEVMQKLKGIETDEESSLGFLIEILEKYFLEGQFPDDGVLAPVAATDIGQLDAYSIIECFKVFTGQELDPKASMPLTSSSPTAEAPQLNS